MATRSRVIGDRETAANLRALSRFVSTPASEASRFALAPTLSEAKANAPVRTGGLRKSLVIRKDERAPKATPTYRVGPRRDSPAARFAHVLEFGRAPNADGTGGLPGLRWLTAAFESTKDTVVKRFGERFGPGVEKHAAKLAAKVRKR